MGEGRVQAGQVLPGTSGWQGADRTALHHPGALQPVPWLQKGVRSWGYMSVEPMGCADGVRRASEGKKGVRGHSRDPGLRPESSLLAGEGLSGQTGAQAALAGGGCPCPTVFTRTGDPGINCH